MTTIDIDPHTRTHTAVAVDEVGKRLGELTITADEVGQQQLSSPEAGRPRPTVRHPRA